MLFVIGGRLFETILPHLCIGPLPDLAAACPEMYVRFPLHFTVRSGWGLYYFGTPAPVLSANDDGDEYNNLLVVEYFLGTDSRVNRAAGQARWPSFERVGIECG